MCQKEKGMSGFVMLAQQGDGRDVTNGNTAGVSKRRNTRPTEDHPRRGQIVRVWVSKMMWVNGGKGEVRKSLGKKVNENQN